MQDEFVKGLCQGFMELNVNNNDNNNNNNNKNLYTGSRHHSRVVFRRDPSLIKSILNKKNTNYVKQIIKSTKSHCSYQNYAKRCNTAFTQLRILSLFLTLRGISFHSLNKKYEERSWPLLQRDLSINVDEDITCKRLNHSFLSYKYIF